MQTKKVEPAATPLAFNSGEKIIYKDALNFPIQEVQQYNKHDIEDKDIIEQRAGFLQKITKDLKGNTKNLHDLVQMAEIAEPNEASDNFQCPICMCLVYKPYWCKSCQNNVFCAPCIEGKIS